MTELIITPNYAKKTARFKGTIAAGEHVLVKIANDDSAIEDTTNLRLRVVGEGGKTLAQFPMPDTEDAWDSDITPISCEFDLNTDRMLKAVPPAATVPLLFVLDAYKGKTDDDDGEFVLFFKDRCEVTHWPRRSGEDEPVPTILDDYADIIADFREDIYGEGGFKDVVENAASVATDAANRVSAALETADNFVNRAEAAATNAQAFASGAQTAKVAAQASEGRAAESASLATAASIAKMRERTGNHLWHNVALSQNGDGTWVMDVDQDSGGGDGTFDAEVKALGTVVPRSIAARFADTVSVRDFGAVGDGTTDDSAAFEAAAQAAPVQDNIVVPDDNMDGLPDGPIGPAVCRVHVPAGTYLISRWLDVGNRDVLWEMDQGAVVVRLVDGVLTADQGVKWLNGVVVRPFERQTRRDPVFARDYACGFTATTGGDYGDKSAPVTGCDSAARYSINNIDQVGIAGCAYARPPVAAVEGVAEAGAGQYAVAVAYDNRGDNGTATFAYAAINDSGNNNPTRNDRGADIVLRRLRRGMHVITRHSQKLMGILGSWERDGDSLILTMQGKWYEYQGFRSGVAQTPVEAPDTPAANFGMDIGVITKAFGGNFVMELPVGCYAKEGIGVEVDVRNSGGDPSEDVTDTEHRTWGVLAGNGGSSKGQVGFIAKGGWLYGFAFHDTGGAGRAFASFNSSGERTFAVTHNGMVSIGRPNRSEHSSSTVRINAYTTGGADPDVFFEFVGGDSEAGGRGNLVIHGTTAFTQAARPAVDNAVSCGAESFRWSQVYAATGEINTSDERAKQDISQIPDAVFRAWGRVGFAQFRFRDAVAAKGESARFHVGVIAQRIVEAFAAEGLDATRYGLLCYDEWGDEFIDKEVIDREAQYDGQGRLVAERVAHVERVLVRRAGSLYSVRYDEALALECAYQRWLGDRREARIAELERRAGA